MKPAFPLSRKLFISHFLATLVVASAIGLFLYFSAKQSLMEQLRVRLKSSAALISRELDATDLEQIQAADDIAKPEYKATLSRLRNLRSTNRDVAFLYVMRLREGKVYFVVDTDETQAQAMPGQQYTQVNARLLEGFTQQSADDRVTVDSWGSFFSGYAPVRGSEGRYMVGVDMRVDEVSRKLANLRQSGAGAFLLAILLSWGIGIYMSRHFRGPIQAIIEQCQAIGQGNLDKNVEVTRLDEMDSLVNAINDMTRDLRRAREENLKAAESLDSALDSRRI